MDVATHRCIRLARGRIDERVEDCNWILFAPRRWNRRDRLALDANLLPSKRRWTIDEEDLVKAIASGN